MSPASHWKMLSMKNKGEASGARRVNAFDGCGVFQEDLGKVASIG